MSDSNDTIARLVSTIETYPPSPDFVRGTSVPMDLREQAARDRLEFWAQRARELQWETPFTEVLDFSDAPRARWFADGRLNVSVNCLDRHVQAGRGDVPAVIFESERVKDDSHEPREQRVLTYADLHRDVCRAANMLSALGVKAGAVVTIYLPRIPEVLVSMLACARIGAIHSVIFAGFSASAIRDRINDADSTFVITANGSHRKGRIFELKSTVDAALNEPGHNVKQVLVVRRPEHEVAMTPGRDLWWHEEIARHSDEHEAPAFDAEHPLFILYTSGTTGKPKGLWHASGGYLTQATYTFRTLFDLREDDIYWSSADVGWVTGHSYTVYGPLAAGATQVMYEGTNDFPTLDRWFEIIERHQVSIFYTAPTAIRGFMKTGREIPLRHDLSSLRLLGSVGEPLNPEAWQWYRDVIGSGRTPIVDTWWQTETGAHMIAPVPTLDPLKAGAALAPVPGISVEVVDDSGSRVNPGEMGLLTVTEPWPSMARGIWGDDQRFYDTYWSRFPGIYFAGDGAGVDKDGHLWLLGRVDDVMNVSGHRLSTTEIESALVEHPFVAEAAVVGAADDVKGQAVVAFVVLKQSQRHNYEGSDPSGDIRAFVAEHIGAIARPRQVFIVSELPKTRSGKIMRRLLKDVAEGRDIGDTTTLTDANVMTSIAELMDSSRGPEPQD